ncbi:hypothetical protein VTN96DRAFT_5966 [Rasamsonia emersonii]
MQPVSIGQGKTQRGGCAAYRRLLPAGHAPEKLLLASQTRKPSRPRVGLHAWPTVPLSTDRHFGGRRQDSIVHYLQSMTGRTGSILILDDDFHPGRFLVLALWGDRNRRN